jgi:hypothetical protein
MLKWRAQFHATMQLLLELQLYLRGENTVRGAWRIEQGIGQVGVLMGGVFFFRYGRPLQQVFRSALTRERLKGSRDTSTAYP